MSILIAEDNIAQRTYLRELLDREFSQYRPILEAPDGDTVVKMALAERPQLAPGGSSFVVMDEWECRLRSGTHENFRVSF